MINHKIEHDCGLQSLRRWNQEQQALERTIARRGWIACLLAALAVLSLFILTAHGDEYLATPDPDDGTAWPAVLMCLGLGALITFVCWQAKVSLPLIFNRQRDTGSK